MLVGNMPVGPWLVHRHGDGERTGRYRLWEGRHSVAVLAEPSLSGGYWWGSGDAVNVNNEFAPMVPVAVDVVRHGFCKTLWGACAAADQWLRKFVEVSS